MKVGIIGQGASGLFLALLLKNIKKILILQLSIRILFLVENLLQQAVEDVIF